MGKYMRKGKVSGEVAVMEVAGALLGVRTRSRTLALQRMQRPPGKGEDDPEPEPGAADFLELRSRRLEKPHPPSPKEKEAAAEELEVSFGDNVLDLDAMERGMRERTPCRLINNSDAISPLGSTTRTSYSMSSCCRMETPICRYIPTSVEMKQFFAVSEQRQQQTFRAKYNFCPVNNCPLPGRYEWVRLDC